ncbi:aminoglycoside phosphotransferase family protein [Streptomyces sp. NBC_01280]|uniref:aminoglycoside phosphotransferase family protein n=1 Tax=Streptomyces sp. NBC_01280 TaxID=2903810 RepID=UPI002E311771|nr:aminoglycoside phosphotransferase family protein [Streptomyces sp. NBC_01280]
MPSRASALTVPLGCRERLVAHYGCQVNEWLDSVPALITAAATAWGLSLGDFHDAGHASVLATATDPVGRPLVLKAWPDPGRYRRETAALRLWYADALEPVIRATDDRHAVAALSMIGDRPGGAERPLLEHGRVAEALHRLHTVAYDTPLSGLPPLGNYIAQDVLRRVHHRSTLTGDRRLTAAALSELAGLHESPHRTTVLHGDLYRENILFRHDGQPVLLDPVPMVGDAVFDWAFWTVYYRLGKDMDCRIRTALQTSGIPLPELLPWCVLLSLDGLLYYEESGDPRLPEMTTTLRALLSHASRSA